MSTNNGIAAKKQPFPESNGDPHKIQEENMEMHADASSVEHTGCDVCLEENNLAKCEHIDKNLHIQHSAEANSSFAESVINMIGMLIGKFIHHSQLCHKHPPCPLF